MILKEVKKIISHKWIIALLLLLCFVNVFVDIRGNASVIEDEKINKQYNIERNLNYGSYIDSIKLNAENISTFNLFDDGTGYQKRSAAKIVKAYETVNKVKPIYGNYIAISKATDFAFCDFIVFLIILQYTILLINFDRNSGMLTLLKSCKKGRQKLAAGKIVTLLAIVALVEVIVFCIRFITLLIIYGCDNIFVPIQSVPDFYECAFNLNIVQYLLIFIIFKIIAVFSYALFLFVLVILFENVGLVYIISGGIVGISCVINSRILWDHILAIFKIASPITLVDIKSLTVKYYNINIGGEPFNVITVAEMVMLMYAVIFSIIGIYIFSRNNIGFHFEKNRNNSMGTKNTKIKSILRMEIKKVFTTNKGLFIVISLCVIQILILNEVDTDINGTMLYYNNYMTFLAGPQTDETEQYINDEIEYYKSVQNDYDEKQQLFIEGRISSTELSIAEDQYLQKMIPYSAFEMVLEQRDLINEQKNDGKEAWYVNDIGINNLIHPDNIYMEKISWMFMLLSMIVMIVTCIGYEEVTGVNKLSDTTLLGRKELFKNKVFTCGFISLITFAISNLSYLILVINSYSFSGVNGPTNSLREFTAVTFIPIWALIAIIYITKFIVMVLATIVVIYISKKIEGFVKKIAISTTIIVIPLIITIII